LIDEYVGNLYNEVMKYKLTILFALCLAACGGGATDTEVYYADAVWTSFEGTFISSYNDGYTIGRETIAYDDGVDDYDFSFTGEVVHCYKFIVFNAETTTDGINAGVKDGSGVFIIKLTAGENAGKYTAIYFRNFHEGSESPDLANAYSEGTPYFDSAVEAEKGFASIAAMNKYVSMWGLYQKKRL
jgi:hypothetical protein